MIFHLNAQILLPACRNIREKIYQQQRALDCRISCGVMLALNDDEAEYRNIFDPYRMCHKSRINLILNLFKCLPISHPVHQGEGEITLMIMNALHPSPKEMIH